MHIANSKHEFSMNSRVKQDRRNATIIVEIHTLPSESKDPLEKMDSGGNICPLAVQNNFE